MSESFIVDPRKKFKKLFFFNLKYLGYKKRLAYEEYYVKLIWIAFQRRISFFKSSKMRRKIEHTCMLQDRVMVGGWHMYINMHTKQVSVQQTLSVFNLNNEKHLHEHVLKRSKKEIMELDAWVAFFNPLLVKGIWVRCCVTCAKPFCAISVT